MPATHPSVPAVAVQLADGRQLETRPAVAEDLPAVLDLYESLSAEARYRRFFQATPHLTGTLRRALSSLENSILWLAFDGERCVGEARVVRSPREPGTGDLAVTIADDYQHRGLGQQLSRMVVAEARRRHLERVNVAILPENTGATRLARRNHIRLHFDGGVIEGGFSLTPRHADAA
jgi:RimJ/RimL family protein N-acetyltransferase